MQKKGNYMKKAIKVLTAGAACLAMIATTAIVATACSSQNHSSINKSHSSNNSSGVNLTPNSQEMHHPSGSSHHSSTDHPVSGVGPESVSSHHEEVSPQQSTKNPNTGDTPPHQTTNSSSSASPSPTKPEKPNRVSEGNSSGVSSSEKPANKPAGSLNPESPIITPNPKVLGKPIPYSVNNAPVLKITTNKRIVNVMIHDHQITFDTGNFGEQPLADQPDKNVLQIGLVNNGDNSFPTQMFTGSNTFNDLAINFSSVTPIQKDAILIVSANSVVSGNGFNLSQYAINGYVYLQFTDNGLVPIQPVTHITRVSTYDANCKNITISGTSYPHATLFISSNNTSQTQFVTANAQGQWTAVFTNNGKANADTVFSVDNTANGVSVYTSLVVPQYAKSFIISSMRYGTSADNTALGMIGFNPFTMHLAFNEFVNPDQYPTYSNPTPLNQFDTPVNLPDNTTLFNNYQANLFSFRYGDQVINVTGNMTIQEIKKQIDSLPIEFNTPISYAVYLNDAQYTPEEVFGKKGDKNSWAYFNVCPGLSIVNNLTELVMPPMSATGQNNTSMNISNFLYEFSVNENGIVPGSAYQGASSCVPYDPTNPVNKSLTALQMVEANNAVIKKQGQKMTIVSYNLNPSDYASGLGVMNNTTYMPSYVVSTHFGSWSILDNYQVTTIPFNEWFTINSSEFIHVAKSLVKNNSNYLTNLKSEQQVLKNAFHWVYKNIAYDERTAGATDLQDSFDQRKGVCLNKALMLADLLSYEGFVADVIGGQISTTGESFYGQGRNVHAWTCVYLPVEHQWMMIDPTDNVFNADQLVYTTRSNLSVLATFWNPHTVYTQNFINSGLAANNSAQGMYYLIGQLGQVKFDFVNTSPTNLLAIYRLYDALGKIDSSH